MSKMGLFVYFWIFIIAILVFAKMFGFADNAIMVILVVVVGTLAFVAVTTIVGRIRKKRSDAEYQVENKEKAGMHPNKKRELRTGKKSNTKNKKKKTKSS